jgi:hypothetical protein
MKAWHVHDGEREANLLIFAPTRNRARYMAWTNGTWEFDSYIAITAVRAPKWDGVCVAERVIDQNADLPEGAEPFYNEEEWCD